MGTQLDMFEARQEPLPLAGRTPLAIKIDLFHEAAVAVDMRTRHGAESKAYQRAAERCEELRAELRAVHGYQDTRDTMAGLRRLADTLQGGEYQMRLHDAGSHVRRAAEMVRAGNVAEALCYLRTLARNAACYRRTVARSAYAATFCNVLLARSLADVVAAYVLALRWTMRLGVRSRFVTRWPVEPTAGTLVDFGDTREDGSERYTIAGYSREVANAHWPELRSHGVYVEVRRVHRAGYWIELQCHPPDEARSQFVVTRNVMDRAEALRVGQALVELGEAVLAAAGEVKE